MRIARKTNKIDKDEGKEIHKKEHKKEERGKRGYKKEKRGRQGIQKGELQKKGNEKSKDAKHVECVSLLGI